MSFYSIPFMWNRVIYQNKDQRLVMPVYINGQFGDMNDRIREETIFIIKTTNTSLHKELPQDVKCAMISEFGKILANKLINYDYLNEIPADLIFKAINAAHTKEVPFQFIREFNAGKASNFIYDRVCQAKITIAA